MAWLYHVFCLTYKWRIADVDALELPMLFCLLDEIGEIPPQDFLAAAQIKAQQRELEREKKGALSSFRTVKGKVRRRIDGDGSG